MGKSDEKRLAQIQKQEASIRAKIEEEQEKLDEILKTIEGFQPEYDEKVEALNKVKNEYDETVNKKDALLVEFEKTATEKIEAELQGKRDEVENLKKEVETKNDDAEALKSEAFNRMQEAIAKEKEAKKNIEDANRASKKEADEYSKKIKGDADSYSKSTKKEADEYSSKTRKDADEYYLSKQTELDEYSTRLDERKKNLDSIESQQNEKEHKLADQEIRLSKAEEDARFDFKKTLLEDKKKFDEEKDEIKNQISNLEKELIEGKAKISDELNEYKTKELKKIDDSLQAERDKIDKEKSNIEKQRADIARQQAELNIEKETLKTTKEAYKIKYDALDQEAEKKAKEIDNGIRIELENMKKHCNELSENLDEKSNEVLKLKAKIKATNNNDLDDLKNENKLLKEEIQHIKDSDNSIIAKLKEYNVDSATLVSALNKINAYDKLIKKYNQLDSDYKDLEVENISATRKEARLAEEVDRANNYKRLYDEAMETIKRLNGPSRKDRLDAFKPYTDFDNLVTLDPFANSTTELEWLGIIEKKLIESQIIIPKRVLYAFHTSVKIHDWSPLVVLAGVSGTGKSELPRQYAQHGGMNFLLIPVKPDWDSMQSLFGYFNSIENKFEPTELSKAIYYLNNNPSMKDTVLMVLLDEMNLAYVELYFSDLLSTFENNRGEDSSKQITYDINLGAGEDPEKLIIGKNILWVGTMNEDETTKALSDKVIDRSSLITFPRPKELKSRSFNIVNAPAEHRITYNQWSSWCQKSLTQEDVKKVIDIDKYKNIVQCINEEMSKLNRNLGHRVWQSIERYVYSHPLVIESAGSKNINEQFDAAFAEAIAFKVMPKLRGIEVSGPSKTVLNLIFDIIKRDIPVLEADFDHAMNLSSKIFQWSSAIFMEDRKSE